MNSEPYSREDRQIASRETTLKTDNNDQASRRYEVFIEGQGVDLCIPSSLAIDEDNWHAWFNQTDRLHNTGHGIFPNTTASQEQVLIQCNTRDRITLLICRKDNQRAVGVISLQQIDLSFRQAEIALTVGELKQPPMMALEAMALLTEHAMDQLGLHRVYAGQAYPGLVGWNKLLELIGYKTDGIHRKAFRRAHHFSDVAHISITWDDYKALVDHRGCLWPDSKTIKILLKKQPRVSFAEQLDTLKNELDTQYFSFLYH